MITKRRAMAMGALAALAASTAACTHADREFIGQQDTGFGDANRATFAAMVINPDPRYDTPIPTTSAEHAAQAIDRYRKDQVKQPDRINTTSVSGGGSGGGGGN